MPRLIGRPIRADRDRGAVTVLVAVLLASGVLLGMAAFSIDLGNMYSEREQLLNAANAAALASAEDCARAGGTCGAVAPAQTVANGSAMDGAVSLDSVCGRWGISTTACPAPVSGPTNCVINAPANMSYTEVHAGTRTASGGTVLPPSFAGALIPGWTGGHIRACARVAWGPPATSYSAFTLSSCKFNTITGGMLTPNVNSFLSAPPYAPPASVEVVLNLQDSTPTGCDDLGYLTPSAPTTSCTVSANQGSNLAGRTDSSSPSGTPAMSTPCTDLLAAKKSAATSDPMPYLLMPIYTSVTTNSAGSATFLNIYGIAAFRVTGYKVGNAAGVPDALNPGLSASSYCGPGTNGQSRCLRGYFVGVDIIDGTTPATGWTHSLGVNVFKTAG